MRRLRRSALLLLLLVVPSPHPARGASPPRLSEAARWLQGYLRIDSSDAAGESRAAAYLARILHREGIATRLLVSPGGHTSLYARLEAERPEAGPLVLLHHLDVVPPGPGWTMDPFGGEVQGGKLWGRGAVDIKSLGIAHLVALIDLARSSTPLRRDVIFLAVADEERGGKEGVGWLLERHHGLFDGAAAVLGEGGANRRINERNLWAGIEVAQKRPLWLRVTARGRGGHGAGLNPGSATHRLIAGLARALELEPEWRVTKAVRLYLGALAPLHNDTWRPIFSDLDRYVLPDGPTRQLMPGLENLFLDTFQVTMLEGAGKINVIPEAAEARVDVRLLPETDADRYLARVTEALEGLQVEVLLSSPPVPPSPTDHPTYRAVSGVLDDAAPVVPAFIPGLTDSRYFRERGIPAYGVSPFFLGPYDLLGIHGADEAIPLDELERGIERMSRIVAESSAVD